MAGIRKQLFSPHLLGRGRLTSYLDYSQSLRTFTPSSLGAGVVDESEEYYGLFWTSQSLEPLSSRVRTCQGLSSFEVQDCEGTGGKKAQISAGVCGGSGPLLLHPTTTLNPQQQFQELLSPWGKGRL